MGRAQADSLQWTNLRKPWQIKVSARYVYRIQVERKAAIQLSKKSSWPLNGASKFPVPISFTRSVL